MSPSYQLFRTRRDEAASSMRLQRPSPAVAGSLTYGFRLPHIRLQVLHAQCGVAEQPQLWSALPYMLALSFTLPK